MILNALFILVPLLLGIVIPLVALQSKPCFKSKYQPPGWVFSIIWPLLYTITGIAAMIVYLKGNKTWGKPLNIWLACLIGILLWWPIFSLYCKRMFALIWLLVLVALSVWTQVAFLKIDKVPFVLQMFMTLWLCFATFLTFTSSSGFTPLPTTTQHV